VANSILPEVCSVVAVGMDGYQAFVLDVLGEDKTRRNSVCDLCIPGFRIFE
jgi:hypothetical protein